jgi:hypothetical protein
LLSRRGVDENTTLARLAAVVHPTDPHPDRVLAASDATALEIVRLANEHRASGLLSRALEHGGRLDSLPRPAREALRGDLLDAQARGVQLDRLLERAAAVLEESETTFLLLKGAALGLLVYPERWLRQMTDVDILVRPADLEAALAALVRAGFEAPPARDVAFWRDAYYNLPLHAPGTDGGLVEIHWSLAQSARHRPDVEGLFARSQPCGLNNARRALGHVDLLLHQALHHSYHYFEPKLAWIYDHALLHQSAPPMREVFTRARAWGMTTPLALSVLQVEKAFPGAADRRLLGVARRSGRARVILALFGARSPVVLLNRWDRRRRQLMLAALMLDRPLSVVTAFASWLRRTIRYGDRAGHRVAARRR